MKINAGILLNNVFLGVLLVPPYTRPSRKSSDLQQEKNGELRDNNTGINVTKTANHDGEHYHMEHKDNKLEEDGKGKKHHSKMRYIREEMLKFLDSLKDPGMLKSPLFLLHITSMACGTVGLQPTLIFVPARGLKDGFTDEQVSSVILTICIVSILTRCVLSICGDMSLLFRHTLYGVCTLAGGINIMLSSIWKKYWSQIIFGAVHGFCQGMVWY